MGKTRIQNGCWSVFCRRHLTGEIASFLTRIFIFIDKSALKSCGYMEIDGNRCEVCSHDYKQPRVGKTNLWSLKVANLHETGTKGKQMYRLKNVWAILWIEVRVKPYLSKSVKLFCFLLIVPFGYMTGSRKCFQITNKWPAVGCFSEKFDKSREPIQSSLLYVDEELLGDFEGIHKSHAWRSVYRSGFAWGRLPVTALT